MGIGDWGLGIGGLNLIYIQKTKKIKYENKFTEKTK